MSKKAVVQLVAETKNYDKKIDGATRQLNDFGKNGVKSLTALAGSWGKLVPAVGAAIGASEAFDKALQSNQALGDAWNNSVNAMKGATNSFFEALTSGDWSVFERGIEDVISRAYEASVALDQLGNSLMSLGVVNVRGNFELQKQMTILRGAKKGSDEYNEALKKAQEIVNGMSASTAVVQNDQWKAIQTQMAQYTGLDKESITFEMVLEMAELDSKENREAIKAQAQEDAKTYAAEMKNAREQYGGFTYQDMYGGKHEFGGDQEALAARQKELNDQYARSVVINTGLAKLSDEQLKNVDDLITAYYGNAQAIEANRTQLARLGKETSGGGGGGAKPGGKNTDLDIKMFASLVDYQNSPEYWQQLIDDAIGNRPLELTLEAPVDEEWVDDSVNDSLKEKLDLYTQLEQKIQSLTGLLEYANETEAEGLKDEIKGLRTAQKGLKTFTKESKKSGKEGAEAMGAMGSVIGSVGGQMSDTAGDVVSGIGSIMTSIASLIPMLMAESIGEGVEKVNRTSNSWYEIIPGIAAVVASIVSAFASFDSGGVVGGGVGYEQGDKILSRIEAGELVLNQSQQRTLNGILDHQGVAGGTFNVRIKNDQLTGTLRNAGNRAKYRV